MELFWLCEFKRAQIFGESGSMFSGAALYVKEFIRHINISGEDFISMFLILHGACFMGVHTYSFLWTYRNFVCSEDVMPDSGCPHSVSLSTGHVVQHASHMVWRYQMISIFERSSGVQLLIPVR